MTGAAGTNPVKAACALVEAAGVYGTGFLVSPELVLTCHHVIKRAGDLPIIAIFPSGRFEARLELVDIANDCALLRLTQPIPPNDAQPLAVSVRPLVQGTAWESYGFPAATRPAGLLLSGTVQDPVGQDSELRPALVLHSANVTAGSLLNGFSGSPVVVDGRVVGQLRRIIPDELGGAQLAVVYACPAELLAELVRRRLGKSVFQPANPYRGLSAFRPEDAQVFFGRESLIPKLRQRFEILHDAPQAQRLVAVLGPSGSGKSSVALAGVLPDLQTQPIPGLGSLRPIIVRPGDRPIESLARSLVPLLPTEVGVLPASRQLALEQLLRHPDSAAEGLRRFAADLPDIAAAPLLIVIDQFEEVYTLCKAPGERQQFVDLILHAASDAGRQVWVLLTLRSDFLGETQRYHPKLNRAIASQHELVPVLSPEELRRVITEPARHGGQMLNGAVVDLLIAQSSGSEGALPLLEFALTQIWEGLVAGKEPAATLAKIGGVGGALALQAQTLYERLSPAEQRMARRAFLRMVHLGEGTHDTRRRVPLSELPGRGETESQLHNVLRPFSDQHVRLVTLSSPASGSEITAEVTHEALFEHWTMLRQWIEVSRADRRFHDRLAEATLLWGEAGRPAGRLWRTPDLNQLRDYERRHPDELTRQQFEFLRQSARRQWLERAALVGISVFIVLLSVVYGIKERLHGIQVRAQERASYVEEGRRLLLDDRRLPALMWLHRAYQEGSDSAALRYLLAAAMAPVDAVVAVLAGHSAYLKSAVFSPDGRRVLSLSSNEVKLWDVRSRACLRTVKLNYADIANFSIDGKRILTLANGRVQLWDANLDAVLMDLDYYATEYKRSLDMAELSPNGLRILTRSRDGVVAIWDARSGKQRHTLWASAERKKMLQSSAFSPDGTRILTLDGEGTTKLWNAEDGSEPSAVFRELKLSHVQFSPDGTRILLTGYDGRIHVLDGNSLAPLLVMICTEKYYSTTTFSPDGNWIAAAGSGGTIELWQVHQKRRTAMLSGHRGGVIGISFSPDNSRVLSGGRDGTARIWDTRTGVLLLTLEGHTGNVQHVNFSPDGTYALTAGWDKTARLWHLQGVREPTILSAENASLQRVTFNPDGRRIAASDNKGTVRLWDVQSRTLLNVISTEDPRAGAESSTRLSFSPGGDLLLCRRDITVGVYDVARGAALHVLHMPVPYRADDSAWSPDGSQIVTSGGGVYVWNARTGAKLATLEEPNDVGDHQNVAAVLARRGRVAFSADGDRILFVSSFGYEGKSWDAHSYAKITNFGESARETGFSSPWPAVFDHVGNHVATDQNDTLRIFDTRSGNVQHLLGVGRIDKMTFSPDDSQLLIAGVDQSASIWEVDDATLKATLDGHRNDITAVAFSIDGQLALTGSADRTVKVWESRTGKLLATLAGHGSVINDLAVSKDGSQLATVSDDGSAIVWQLPMERRSPQELAALIGCLVPYRFDHGLLVPIEPNYAACQPLPDRLPKQ